MQRMRERIRDWLAERGFPETQSVAPATAGLGDTTLWKISRSDGEDDLLVRMFPAGAEDAAAREVIAMTEAARHGVPVPEIVLLDYIDEQPVLVTTWCPGEP